MIELVIGEKGKGKSKTLVARANNDHKASGARLVYIDINNKNLSELDTEISLVNATEYNIKSTEMFIGFMYGMLALDKNLDKIFLDNFTSIAGVSSKQDAEDVINTLNNISQKCDVDFVISLSASEEDLSDSLKELVTISL
ncbi:MAG: twitching motility protein PilT [Lachnospiraceae bacterium]|nr:twitching motility protein PilT [Lachnospiraceae bacterium]